MDLTTDLGTYVEINARPAVRFERIYPHPIDRVWTTITDPAEMAHWFPAPEVSIEPRTGGTIRFGGDPHTDDLTGTVLAWEPPSRLAFSWGGDELRFDLEALDATSCRLVLLDVLEQRNAAARNAGGWLVCLGELAKTVAGNPGHGPHSDSVIAPWPEVYEAHVAAGLPYGAEIPELT
jgi:uncharacterized protein YndB with AHSA1/START domain